VRVGPGLGEVEVLTFVWREGVELARDVVRGGEVEVEGSEGCVGTLQLVRRVHRRESIRLVQRVLNVVLHFQSAYEGS
jgi:hypothetical protein